MDVATVTAVATPADDAIGAVLPLSLPNSKDAYISMLVAFKDVCFGAFTEGANESAAGEGGGGGSLAPWGTTTMAALVDSIVTGTAIIIAILVIAVVDSRDVGAEGGVGRGVHPLSLSLLMLAAAALYLNTTAERAPLNAELSHLATLWCPLGISPSLTSHLRPTPHYFP